MEERLQKLMAQTGFGSRRQCEEIIAEKRVTVNGRLAHLGDKADLHHDDVRVDGKRLPAPEQKLYIMLHKPWGILSDEDDTGEGRTTARQLIQVEGHLYPVGRLDKNSVGLMLFTNDGELAHKLTHPSFEHEKIYRVKVSGQPSNEVLRQWARGVELEDGMTAPARVRLEKQEDEYAWIRITMREGRKRQIRRVATLLGHTVLHLHREQLGPLKLGDLPLGKWRHLTRPEISQLRRYVLGDRRPNVPRRRSSFGNPRR
ncbi:MAG: pseudouridine synthase [Chloroflexi bacterium]|nr:pseudouridine synthase [Chloroflexota bacterium]